MLENLKLVVSLIPLIIQLIRQVEVAFPNLKGAEKLQATKVLLTNLYDGAESIWPSISSLITGLVAIYNRIGWTPPDPPPSLKSEPNVPT